MVHLSRSLSRSLERAAFASGPTAPRRLVPTLALALAAATGCGAAGATTTSQPPIHPQTAPPVSCVRIVCDPNADYGQPTLTALKDAESRIGSTPRTSTGTTTRTTGNTAANTGSSLTGGTNATAPSAAGQPGPAGPTGPAGPAGPAGPTSPDFNTVYTRYKASIARFETQICSSRTYAEGSGFLVAPSLVATAAHVVRGQKILGLYVGGHQVSGRVIGLDANRDFALVRLNASLPAPTVPLATAWPKVGEPLAVMGYALGGPLSMQQGHVAAVDVGYGSVPHWLATDTAEDHGSSGGPVLDGKGAAVGIVSQNLGSAGLVHLEVSSLTASQLISTWKAHPMSVPPAC